MNKIFNPDFTIKKKIIQCYSNSNNINMVMKGIKYKSTSHNFSIINYSVIF